MPPSWMFLKIQIYREISEVANIFARGVKYDTIIFFSLEKKR